MATIAWLCRLWLHGWFCVAINKRSFALSYIIQNSRRCAVALEMSSAVLRQKLDELYGEICSCKVLAESWENHLNVTSRMRAKNPEASLRIPSKLFLLWSEVRGIQAPPPAYIHLLKLSLESNSGFTIFPTAKGLEDRLRKECSRTCIDHSDLRHEYAKDGLRDGEKRLIVYANEGALQSSIPSNPNPVPADSTDTPKLRVGGQLYSNYVSCICMQSVY